MSNAYYKNLIETVINLSEADNFDEAVKEWMIYDCKEDETNSSACVCGKENLRYLFTIKNNINGNFLFPIGSSCIKKFNREDLNEISSLKESLFKLYHAIDENVFLSLSPDLFTRKLLKHLFDIGAFSFNSQGFNPEKNYTFMLKMFNKRNKEEITEKQHKKIIAILLSNIKPFIKNELKNKVNNCK